MNLKLMMQLSNVKRWTVIPTSVPDDVASHSFRVAAIAIAMAEKMNVSDYDIMKIAYWSMLHDSVEGITGDILSPVKARLLENGVNLDIIWECEFNEGCPKPIKDIIKAADQIDNFIFIKTYGVGPRANTGIVFYEDKMSKWIFTDTDVARAASKILEELRNGY